MRIGEFCGSPLINSSIPLDFLGTMKILLSIRPEFAELILRGEKAYEFRRVLFRNPSVRSALIYATRPIGKVIGQFDIAQVISGSPAAIWKQTKHRAGV